MYQARMHIGFLPVNRRTGRFPPRSAASGLAAVSFLYLIFEAPDGADIAYFRGGRFCEGRPGHP